MSWAVAAIVVDQGTACFLVERHAGLAGHVARLPIVDLADGRPTGEDLCAAVEALLGRPVEPIWLRSSESDDASESGEAAILTLADPASDARGSRSFVPAADVVDTLEPEMARAAVRSWLDRLAGSADPRTPAWMVPGWFERV